jgi:outer membrane protein TolC
MTAFRMPIGLRPLTISLAVVTGFAGAWAGEAAAQSPTAIDLSSLAHGVPAFPRMWRSYRPPELPVAELHNGPLLTQRIVDGRLRVSLKELLQLVVENNLDLQAARYDYAVAQVDLLRAQSGQAARGTPSSPIPAGLFSGAIGAGVNATAGLSAGGTGGAAITTQGKLVFVGPRGNFDPTFSMNLSYDHLANPLNSKVVAGLGTVTVPSVVLQTQFQQALPTGTSYSVSLNLQHQSSTQTGLLFNPALSSFVALQLYQPLLNGFGVALNRRFVTLADNDRKVVREGFRTTLTNTLATAADAYWDLIALRENVGVAEQTVAAAQQAYDEDRQREIAGVMSRLDVITAESQLASTRVQLVTARTQEQQQETLVKTLISQVDDHALDDVPVEPTDELPNPAPAPALPIGPTIAKAITSRSSVRQAELTLLNEHIAQDYTRRNLLPTLSLFAVMDLYGLSATTSPALRQLVEWAYPEYSAGVTFTVPVFNRSAQADDVRARLETQQAELALQRVRDQVEVQVRTSALGLGQGQAQVAAAARATEASRASFAGERERFDLGTATSLLVVQAQRDLTSAQAAEIQARVNYAKAVVAYQVAADEFLQANGIEVERALHGSLFKEPPK